MNKSFRVDYNSINTRLDRWFRRNVHDVPQSLIEKNIRKGKIKVNNKKKKSSYKLQKNDQIFVYNFNFAASKNKKTTTKFSLSSINMLDDEDSSFLVALYFSLIFLFLLGVNLKL